MPFEIGGEYLGEWEPFIFDKEKQAQVFLRIRPLTESQNERMLKKYGVMKMNKRQGVRQRVIPVKNQKLVGMENVVFMLTGMRNAYVKVANAATAEFFSKRLGKECKVGDEILLPEDLYHPEDLDPKAPRPLNDIKRLLVEQDVRITTKVVEIGYGTDDEAVEDMEAEREEEIQQEQELTKN